MRLNAEGDGAYLGIRLHTVSRDVCVILVTILKLGMLSKRYAKKCSWWHELLAHPNLVVISFKNITDIFDIFLHISFHFGTSKMARILLLLVVIASMLWKRIVYFLRN